METKRRLLMTFLTGVGRKVSIGVDDPREDLREDEIIEAMNLIVEKDVFFPYGSEWVSAVEAKVVVTDTTEYDLAI